MLNKSFKACMLAGCLMLWTGGSYAAGLGKLTVTSALGQRLRAEIDLVSVQNDELSTLAARLASPEAFKNANLEYVNALTSINLAIDKRANGQPFIKLTSSQPIEEPILDMLIELSWASGRLVREYTALMDPVEYAAPPAAPVARPETKTATKPAPPVSAKIRPAEEATRTETPAPAPSVAPSGDGAVTVKPGDTLVKIARANAVEGISLEQMLVGLYQNNPEAFAGKNINRLKTGKILRVPDRETLAAVEPGVAVQEVKAQAANWNAYRQKLAGIAAAAAPTDAGTQSAIGKISASVEDKGAVAADPNREVLKLSKGEDRAAGASGSSAGAGAANVLQERVRGLEEEATARERALQEANERVAQLEGNIKSMQRLLEIRNDSLAQTQAAAAATPTPKPAEPEAPTATVVAPTTPQLQPAAAPQVDPQLASPPVAAAAPEQVAKATLPLDPPVAPEVSLIDRVLDEPLYLVAGALAIGLIGFAVFRRRSQPGFENSIMSGGDLTGNTVFGNSVGGVVDTSDSSLITDFGKVGLDHIATDEVDPVAEAEVYIAYGRDAQAEEILKEALDKNPQRFEIHLKLLEIYAARLNLSAFETLAGELYAATGGQGETWAKAAAIGVLLEPANPLYAGAFPSDVGQKAASQNIGLESNSGEAMGQITKSEFDFDNTAVGAAPSEAPADAGRDMEFESHKIAHPAADHTDLAAMDFNNEAVDEKPVAPASMIDFDFDLGPEPAKEQHESITLSAVEEPAAEAAQQTLAPAEEPMFDFDLEPPREKAPEPVMSTGDSGVRDEPAVVSIRPELKDIDLGFSSPKTEAERPGAPVARNDQWYDVQTKFDLAKAYQEMGDNEGAREILQEVVQEGDAEQQANSKALLASLG